MESEEYYSYIAFAFLDGLIFPKIKELKKYYISSVKDCLEKGNMTSKVTKMIQQLRNQGVDNKAKFIEKWEDNPYYLLDVMNLWLNQSGKSIIKTEWN